MDERAPVDPGGLVELMFGGALILDVREPEEWSAGRIVGSVHVPLGDLGDRLSEFPTDQTVVVVCRSGHRSGLATEALVSAGIDARNLDGGLLAWAVEGRPLANDAGEPGQVI